MKTNALSRAASACAKSARPSFSSVSSRRISKRAISECAREAFGFDRLRSGQEEAIRAVLEGRDTLAIFPTGSGKSAIYAIASAMTPGATIVISPLIALQHDQAEALNAAQAGQAEVVNSTRTKAQRDEAFERALKGEVKYLFLAPEQLSNSETMSKLRALKPALFVVDEAHCVTAWGHDFRPDYLDLGQAIERLGHPTVLALTATAAPPVRREIIERLGMRDPLLLVRGFDRPEIFLEVRPFSSESSKTSAVIEEVVEAVESGERPGIVYAATRADAECLAHELGERGVRAASYHAGMAKREREEVQDAFMADKTDVLCATIAFGMGVDKANVRWIFHHSVSDSLDSYYQEVGRAGRDGQDSRAVLFYNPADLGLKRFHAAASPISPTEAAQIAAVVSDHDEGVDEATLREELDIAPGKLSAALHVLQDIGAVQASETGELALTEDAPPAREIAQRTQEITSQRRDWERSRLEMVREYSEAAACRRSVLLSYFGDETPSSCGACDNCIRAQAQTDAAPATEAQSGAAASEDEVVRSSSADEATPPFAVGARVAHSSWGVGEVLRYEEDKVTVLFDAVGYKTLAVNLVVENGLLAAA
jgi:ATP-dependent DNA helicase RecQ